MRLKRTVVAILAYEAALLAVRAMGLADRLTELGTALGERLGW